MLLTPPHSLLSFIWFTRLTSIQSAPWKVRTYIQWLRQQRFCYLPDPLSWESSSSSNITSSASHARALSSTEFICTTYYCSRWKRQWSRHQSSGEWSTITNLDASHEHWHCVCYRSHSGNRHKKIEHNIPVWMQQEMMLMIWSTYQYKGVCQRSFSILTCFLDLCAGL